MGITAFGLVFVPLVAINCTRPERLAELIFLGAIFTAASAFDIGNLGVTPAMVPTAALVVSVLVMLLLGLQFPGDSKAIRTMTPLLIAGAYGLATSIILPWLFAGRVYVHPQKQVLGFFPLEFGQGNVTQSIYLVANMAILALASIFLTRDRVDFKKLLNAYLFSGFLASGFAFWHFASRTAGVWYPLSFLDSNPGNALLSDEVMAGVPRTSGTFTEPAALGGAMVGYVFTCAWLLIRGHRSRLAWLLLPCALLGTLISTSTTGFAALAAGGAWLLARTVVAGSRQLVRKVMIGCAVLIISAAVTALIVPAVAPAVVREAAFVISATANKQESSSYQDRTRADIDSLATLVPTYGLGVGWGSTRSSSLIPGLLASLGIYGFALLPWFAIRLLRQVARVRRTARATSRFAVIDAMMASVFAELVSGAISGPVIDSPAFFLKLAIIVGCASRIEAELMHCKTRRRREVTSCDGGAVGAPSEMPVALSKSIC